jgi:FkbM family methyltransferase
MQLVDRAKNAALWRLERLHPRRRATRLGLRLTLDLRDNAQRVLYYERAYEPNLSRLLLASLREGDVYCDIGAHIGIHALRAARCLQELGGGHVYAFEPSPTADRLEGAAKDNAIDNITVVRVAVGDSHGMLELRGDPGFGPGDAAVLSAYGSGPRVGVFPMIRLDDWSADLDRLDVVKVDVEGSELAALAGMCDTLRRLAPRLLLVEQNEVTLKRSGHTASELHDAVERAGYRFRGHVVDHGTVLNAVFAPV